MGISFLKLIPLWLALAIALLSPHAQAMPLLGEACRGLYARITMGKGIDLAIFQDADSRENFLDDIFFHGDKDYLGSDTFAQMLLALSSEEQAAWKQAIGEVYRRVPKKNAHSSNSNQIAGRRLLDRVLTLVDRVDLQFASCDSGCSRTQFLKDYLDRQAKIFQTGYSGEEVLAVLQIIQKKMQVLASRSQGNEEAYVSLGGSFLNGKALLTSSDLDLIPSRLPLAPELLDVSTVANAFFNAERPRANLVVETHNRPQTFYGEKNALVAQISASEIRIFVYGPARRVGDDHLVPQPVLSFVLGE